MLERAGLDVQQGNEIGTKDRVDVLVKKILLFFY